jgi:rhodanese-related sulfurtransferase
MNKIAVYIVIVIGLVVAYYLNAQEGGNAAYENLTVEQVKEKIKTDKDIVLLDVRTPAEFSGPLGHIDGAILIPVQELQDRIGELDKYKGKEVIVYCRSGNRSRAGATIVSNAGFKAYNMLGGMKAWK